jgi:hypothetical protein
MQIYKCKKCGKKISGQGVTGLCKSCAAKERYRDKSKHPNFKDGRSSKQYYCIECGKEITVWSGLYSSGMCGHCSHKDKPSSFKGKKHTKATRDKISKALTGKKREPFTKATKEKMSIAQTGKKVSKRTCEKISKAKTIHGLSHLPYTKEFTKSLKNEIRQLDNLKCQCCGMTQEEHYNKWGKDIEVHHIDYCTFNCNKNNLITLCKKCNMKANSNRDYWYAFYSYLMENRK